MSLNMEVLNACYWTHVTNLTTCTFLTTYKFVFTNPSFFLPERKPSRNKLWEILCHEIVLLKTEFFWDVTRCVNWYTVTDIRKDLSTSETSTSIYQTTSQKICTFTYLVHGAESFLRS